MGRQLAEALSGPTHITIHTSGQKRPTHLKWNVFTLNVWNVFSIFRNTIWFNSAREFPFLVHLYAWPSPQARSLCICKQHEDAFVLQNWVSHGKIHSVEKKANVISLPQQHPYCVFFLQQPKFQVLFAVKDVKMLKCLSCKAELVNRERSDKAVLWLNFTLETLVMEALLQIHST